MTAVLALSPEVAHAQETGQPVVALESTIISHGMPHPRGVETAREVERIVRAGGAVPATIAVLGGVPRVGLTEPELELLGSDPSVVKVSARDLAHAVATRQHGGTTVAATMRLAALAGIPVFVTGGIGGVHRGAASTMDISADLTELGRTPVTVVSAGVKSILDVGLTLEVLESLGVPVVGFGTGQFPAFYSRSSGFPAPLRVDTVEELAAVMCAQRDLRLPGGICVANPVPAAEEIPRDEIDRFVEAALAECTAREVHGRDVTPFLLGRVTELSGGRSLETNVALLRHNARLGAALAVSYAALPPS